MENSCVQRLGASDSNEVCDFLKNLGEDLQASAFLKEVGKEYNHSFAIYEAGKVVCYIGWLVSFDSADLIFVGTSASSRNKGYATKIIEYSFECLKNLGVQRVLLEVCDKNTSALNLYKKLGFKKIFVRENYYGNTLDGIVMELVL